ncbi:MULTISPECIES: hypothetical protein [unclassified Mesorhizobium]|uniref:hypothetical protein n=1 Tax=unclassified Mesorhizobium TaxID=325217 RepID=UPI001129BC2F|nr:MULTISPECIES: hypothetical protein [unclassified Mesorhizobium]MCA0027366.1 hypothetical protein [Mesorhizobium sp. B263B1A]TPJ98640.1 hypothetical protein FJ489_06850 [Mesorhizobium sp. B2-5-12]TPK28803.1 hypothetical protein FJ562_00240 [Mesorhizobium sp. B2-5-6]TPN16212.1 hypothetical protein FJ973_05845 [Mesorhizobium sp. B2-1-3]
MADADDFRAIPRLTTDAERRHLKGLTRTVLAGVNGGDAFAPSTRVEKAALSKYGSNSFPDHFIPLDVAIELDRFGDAPALIGAAAAMLGFRLVPAGEAAGEEISVAASQSVAKETSDVVNLLLNLLAQRKHIDAADRRDILKEVTEAVAALYRVAARQGGGVS